MRGLRECVARQRLGPHSFKRAVRDKERLRTLAAAQDVC